MTPRTKRATVRIHSLRFGDDWSGDATLRFWVNGERYVVLLSGFGVGQFGHVWVHRCNAKWKQLEGAGNIVELRVENGQDVVALLRNVPALFEAARKVRSAPISGAENG